MFDVMLYVMAVCYRLLTTYLGGGGLELPT